METSFDFCSHDDLKDFVNQQMCEHGNFEFGVFPFSERTIQKKGMACGIMFTLHGPRSVQLTAIWEWETNTVLFYGSNGERLQRISIQTDAMLQSAA